MMVQANRQHPFQSIHLDASRILGLSGAIALNAAALLLLLMPMAAPEPVPAQVIETPYEVIPREKPKPLIPVPVTQPDETKPVKNLPQVQHQVVRAPVQVSDPVLVADGTEQAFVVDTEAMEAIAPVQGPLTGVSLEYAHAPPPAYPRAALRAGLTGTVMLQVLVGVDGRPLDVMVAASSGHRQLDEAARRHVLQRWTFRPAMRDGQPVQAVGLVPIAFDLDQ
jgi:protein TonB